MKKNFWLTGMAIVVIGAVFFLLSQSKCIETEPGVLLCNQEECLKTIGPHQPPGGAICIEGSECFYDNQAGNYTWRCAGASGPRR